MLFTSTNITGKVLLWFYVIAMSQENWRAAGLSLEAGFLLATAVKSACYFQFQNEWKITNNIRASELKYRKILKTYFSQALFEGLILGEAYIRRSLSMEGNLHFKIDWASRKVGSKFIVFALFYFAFEGNFPSTSPRGGGTM